ncbi:MAG TPA: TetR/AcrR family transcriptional regulator [Nocardioidaceae bacterium]|nr:TetR/AcrR family transcriptional regulator [Nocardioidaceae bacterium]
MPTVTMPTVSRVDDPMTPVGERLVQTASRLFYARGIRAVGVDLIAADAGTTKKTLYDRFGSKDALVVLCLRRRAERWQTRVLEHLAAHPEPGPGRVLAVFDALEDWLTEQWRGCAFVNAYAEIGGTDHPALPVVHEEKAWMRALFSALVQEAGYDDAARLGAQLHVLYEGAVVLLTAGNDGDALAQARGAAARLLGR